MFREMRRKDRKIETSEATAILKKCNYGVLSTGGVNGYAYGVPLSFVYIHDCIYFHCAPEGEKLDNIKSNPNVSFCVVGDTLSLPEKFSTNYESVVIFGKAVEVHDGEKNEALLAFIDKYSSQHMEKGTEYIGNAGNKAKVVKICIENLTGKARR